MCVCVYVYVCLKSVLTHAPFSCFLFVLLYFLCFILSSAYFSSQFVVRRPLVSTRFFRKQTIQTIETIHWLQQTPMHRLVVCDENHETLYFQLSKNPKNCNFYAFVFLSTRCFGRSQVTGPRKASMQQRSIILLLLDSFPMIQLIEA